MIPQIKVQHYKSFLGRAKQLYKLRSEENKLITYVPNQAQKVLERVREEEFARSTENKGVKHCRIILLKSRQVGGTTDTAVYNSDVMLHLPEARGIVLAHDDKSVPIIYDKYKVVYNNLPEYIEIVDENGNSYTPQPKIVKLQPDTESYSGYRLKFSEGTNAAMTIRTAGGGDNVGKGDTLNLCHASEAANYDYFDDVMASITQSMPNHSPFLYSVIESTANGVSGKGEGFYQMWIKSEQEWKNFKQGKTSSFQGYRPVFVPWYDMLKYREPLINDKLIDISNIDFGSPEAKKDFLEMEEKIVEEVFDTKQEGLQAINWYRWCIKTNCKYSLNVAKRYYPTTPEDAFISSDKCFFDTPKLFQVKKKFELGEEPKYELGFIDDDFQFEESTIGSLKIWEHPDLSWENRYVVSLDPSYGIEDGDYSCIMVFDRLEQKFVAKWYGNLKEDLIAEELIKIATYYNDALIIPEMNLNTVVTIIKPDGLMPYQGPIYYRSVKSRGTLEYGFHTLGNTRKVLLDTYNAWLRDDYFKIMDKDTLDEHLSFIKRITHGLPKYEAAQGKHDDMVIACALCIYADQWWDEEIFQRTDDGKDIKQIISKKRSNYNLIKLSKLQKGGKKTNNKPFRQTNLLRASQ